MLFGVGGVRGSDSSLVIDEEGGNESQATCVWNSRIMFHDIFFSANKHDTLAHETDMVATGPLILESFLPFGCPSDQLSEWLSPQRSRMPRSSKKKSSGTRQKKKQREGDFFFLRVLRRGTCAVKSRTKHEQPNTTAAQCALCLFSESRERTSPRYVLLAVLSHNQIIFQIKYSYRYMV